MRRAVSRLKWCLAGGSQHRHQPAHLAERLVACGPDVSESGPGERRVVLDRLLGGARLDDDRAHRVGDDVVPLARDPGPLVEHRTERLFGGVPLRAHGPFERNVGPPLPYP